MHENVLSIKSGSNVYTRKAMILGYNYKVKFHHFCKLEQYIVRTTESSPARSDTKAMQGRVTCIVTQTLHDIIAPHTQKYICSLTSMYTSYMSVMCIQRITSSIYLHLN